MVFVPLDKMWERVDVARQESDTALFLNLLYLGETLTKLISLGCISGISNDPQRHRYRQLHRLVRAQGLGDWSTAIDDVLAGPAAQYLFAEAKREQRELTQKCGPGDWQYEAVVLLHQCIRVFEPSLDNLSRSLDARKWFSLFVTLRNKTRGHGAPSSATCSSVCPNLERSMRVFSENHFLFRRPWAYLYRNLSGKYRVTKLSNDGSSFDYLKKSAAAKLENGIYIFFDEPARVELMESDVDAVDFLFANGAFNGKRFELISYISGNRGEGDASPYLAPAENLPPSKTQGIGTLETHGRCFGNLPPKPKGYIDRQSLERELFEILMDDRHPVLTLVGRGGIGKTSLALTVLHRLTEHEKFLAMLWFSARDIDLLPEGPKLVRPHILAQGDIAKEVVRLLQPSEAGTSGFDANLYLSEALGKGVAGGPLLFIFDNFETVRNPAELYTWINTYIRLPNKILITTRIREFKGDYPVEVLGMTEAESEELITTVSNELGIFQLLTPQYRRDLYAESDGHPYVIKILLGEIVKNGRLSQVERIVAGKDDILDALFERTFVGLSPAAKRVFLTLSSWRSTLPQLAVEAVLMRPSNEKMDVEAAIEELRRSSFIEVSTSQESSGDFLTVPLVASVFGRRKLAVSPMKSSVEADTAILRCFGAAQASDIRHGIQPRVERLFKHIASEVSKQRGEITVYLPILEFLARQYAPAWLMLASLYEELGSKDDLMSAKEALRRYIESHPIDRDKGLAWERLATLCRRTEDWTGEAHALVEMSQLATVPFQTLSNAANRLNSLFRLRLLALDTEEKQIVVKHLVEVMDGRLVEGDATDCSRLAWLYLHLKDEAKAAQVASYGLRLDPQHEHCNNLLWRFTNK